MLSLWLDDEVFQEGKGVRAQAGVPYPPSGSFLDYCN
jgi:hypothetical protein